jgi:hypothetical protein
MTLDGQGFLYSETLEFGDDTDFREVLECIKDFRFEKYDLPAATLHQSAPTSIDGRVELKIHDELPTEGTLLIKIIKGQLGQLKVIVQAKAYGFESLTYGMAMNYNRILSNNFIDIVPPRIRPNVVSYAHEVVALLKLKLSHSLQSDSNACQQSRYSSPVGDTLDSKQRANRPEVYVETNIKATLADYLIQHYNLNQAAACDLAGVSARTYRSHRNNGRLLSSEEFRRLWNEDIKIAAKHLMGKG